MKILVGIWQVPSGGGVGDDPIMKSLAEAVGQTAMAGRKLTGGNWRETKREGRLSGWDFDSIFLAPEYLSAAPGAGSWRDGGGGFIPRSLDEDEKDMKLNRLVSLSYDYPETLIVPGTIAWKKSLTRTEEHQYKKDSAGVRTTTLKDKSRAAKAYEAMSAYHEAYGQKSTAPKVSDELAKAVFRHVVIDVLHICTLEQWRQDPLKCVQLCEERNEQIQVNCRLLLADPKRCEPVMEKENLGAHHRCAVASNLEKMDLANAAMTGAGVKYIARNTAYVLLGGKVRFKYNKVGDFHEAVGDPESVFIPGTHTGYFELKQGGPGMGLEVCLDHQYGVLAQSLKSKLKNKTPKIQMLLSDQVQVEWNFVACDQRNGYFLHASATNNASGVYEFTNGSRDEVQPDDEGEAADYPIWFYTIEVW